MITCTLSEKKIEEIEKQLEKLYKNPRAIVKKAVNNTAKQAKKRIVKRAKRRYVIKNDNVDFNNEVKITNATVSKGVAIIKAKGSATDLYKHKVTPNSLTTGNNRPAVLKAKILRSSSMAPLEDPSTHIKAFIAKFDSTHITVVTRVKGMEYTKKKKLDDRKKKHLDTTMIRKLLTSSVPHMLGKGSSFLDSLMDNEVKSDLENNLMKYIDQALGG